METKVEVVETTLVAPSEETPRLGLWLSNLDVTAAMTHTALVYYYPAPAPTKKADDEGFFSPDRLRTALAKALVPFYPLAGRLQIECHGEGALALPRRKGGLRRGGHLQQLRALAKSQAHVRSGGAVRRPALPYVHVSGLHFFFS
jgi:hypothetical protein